MGKASVIQCRGCNFACQTQQVPLEILDSLTSSNTPAGNEMATNILAGNTVKVYCERVKQPTYINVVAPTAHTKT